VRDVRGVYAAGHPSPPLQLISLSHKITYIFYPRGDPNWKRATDGGGGGGGLRKPGMVPSGQNFQGQQLTALLAK
jgi:hypothetical protein